MKKLSILFNPYERYDMNRLALIGIISFIIGTLLGYSFNGYYDGTLDLHFTDSISFGQAFFGNLLSTLSLIIVFWGIGKILNSKIRLIDVIAVSLIARIPLYLLTLSNVYNINYEIGQALFLSITQPERNIPLDAVILSAALGLIAILSLAWQLILLIQGFRKVTQSHGNKLIIGLIGTIFFAEVISKVVIYFLA